GKLIQLPSIQGAKILLGRYTDPGGYYLFDVTTGQEIRLKPFPPDQGAGAPGATMRVSPTGERILYTLFNNMEPLDPEGIGSVWTMKLDGTDHQKLAGSDEFSYPANAIWSPDGKRIAYLRFPDPKAVWEGKKKAEEVELWVMNVDGSEQRKVAQLPPTENIFGTNGSMQWLLDDHIYIVTQITTLGEWLRINPYNGEVTRLLEGVQPWDIVISPDTRWILVSGAMTEEKVIALGRRPLRLPSIPVWDRTGGRIAFIQAPYPYSASSEREEGIWVRDMGSDQETLVVRIPVLEALRSSQIALSPDGTMLLYETKEGIHVVWIGSGIDRLIIPDPFAGMQSPPFREGVEFIAWVPVTLP
ncbi:MAG: TolB family protein, partial [Anaerolineae bacterium]